MLGFQWAEILMQRCTAGKEVVQGGRNGEYNLPIQPGLLMQSAMPNAEHGGAS